MPKKQSKNKKTEETPVPEKTEENGSENEQQEWSDIVYHPMVIPQGYSPSIHHGYFGNHPTPPKVKYLDPYSILPSKKITYVRTVEILHFSDNDITHITNLHDFEYLRELFLANNRISRINIGDLAMNKCVEILDLSGNQLSFIHGIRHLNHLRILKLDRNRIYDTDHLFQTMKNMRNLFFIDYRHNWIDDQTNQSQRLKSKLIKRLLLLKVINGRTVIRDNNHNDHSEKTTTMTTKTTMIEKKKKHSMENEYGKNIEYRMKQLNQRLKKVDNKIKDTLIMKKMMDERHKKKEEESKQISMENNHKIIVEMGNDHIIDTRMDISMEFNLQSLQNTQLLFQESMKNSIDEGNGKETSSKAMNKKRQSLVSSKNGSNKGSSKLSNEQIQSSEDPFLMDSKTKSEIFQGYFQSVNVNKVQTRVVRTAEEPKPKGDHIFLQTHKSMAPILFNF